ncbi:MAG: hypothetical protein IKQ39_05075 [Oscillospiraceae bacterium]|nr:hypothetical protein [Oscillospiraceae bacterium]
MILTSDAIEKGELTVSPEQASAAAAEVQQYNELAEKNRLVYKRRVRDINDYYGFANLILTAVMATGGRRHRYPMPILSFTSVSYLLILVHVTAVIMLAIIKKDLFRSACISCVLAAASWVYFPLIAANWCAVLIRDSAEKSLQTQPGYPHFHEVRLHVEKQYTPPARTVTDVQGKGMEEII